MTIINDWIERFNSYFSGFSQKFADIIANPTTLLALGGLFIILFAFIKFNKVKLDAKILSRMGLAIALTCVLHILRIYRFPQGGSVTLGSMIPILIIAYAYGKEIGMLTGLIFGILNLFLDPYILHPVQVLFDYPLPFMAIGLAGAFRNKPLIGAGIGFFVRFICHFISGVVFFGEFAPEGTSPIIYSLSVNAAVVGAEAVVCIVLLYLLKTDRLISFLNPNKVATQ